MACGTPVLALRRGSVEEVDRRAVRRRFEERFTATRMANDYVRVYNALLTREHAKTGHEPSQPSVRDRGGAYRRAN